MAAKPSPRPVRPKPSVVVAPNETGEPTASVNAFSASSLLAPIFGLLPINCTATLSIFHPASLTIFAAAERSLIPLAPFHSGLSVPKLEPKSPKPAAD